MSMVRYMIESRLVKKERGVSLPSIAKITVIFCGILEYPLRIKALITFLRYNPGSRPNGRVITARFFWAIVFERANQKWHCRTLLNKPSAVWDMTW